MEDPCFPRLPPFKSHITCDQFLISMYSLGMGIGKKNHTLMKAQARVFNAIYIILYDTMW